MFNMRTNGQFTFYFREKLDLIDKAKEYKYVAKERRRSDDDDDAPRTLQQDIVEAISIAGVCILMGVIGGMLYGTLTDAGVPKGILFGTAIGVVIAALPSIIGLLMVAFGPKEMLRKVLIQNAIVAVALIGVTISFFSMGGWSLIWTPAAPAAAPAPAPGSP
jgi:ABC-type arginine transport system permease subunit